MLLRSSIERVIPVRPGERKLSKAARKAVFYGSYRGRGNTIQNVGTFSEVIGGSTVRRRYVTRAVPGNPPKSSIGKRIDTLRDDIGSRQLGDHDTLTRANRVEEVARELKLRAAVGAAAVAVLLGAPASSPSSPSERHELLQVPGPGRIAEASPQANPTGFKLGEQNIQVTPIR